MKQTAVEWYNEQLDLYGDITFNKEIEICQYHIKQELLYQAKAMEKRQMKALYTMHMVDTRTMELYDFDEYYNETFKSK